jgi:hypothetical protein
MFKMIVWANDGSEAAGKVLPVVKELANDGGATVAIVHVPELVHGSRAVFLPHRAEEREIQEQLES